MGGDGNPAERKDCTMEPTMIQRDEALRITYRDLAAAELALGQAQTTLLGLGWTTAGNELGDALATVRDLLHDLAAAAGSNGAEL